MQWAWERRCTTQPTWTRYIDLWSNFVFKVCMFIPSVPFELIKRLKSVYLWQLCKYVYWIEKSISRRTFPVSRHSFLKRPQTHVPRGSTPPYLRRPLSSQRSTHLSSQTALCPTHAEVSTTFGACTHLASSQNGLRCGEVSLYFWVSELEVMMKSGTRRDEDHGKLYQSHPYQESPAWSATVSPFKQNQQHIFC